MHSAAVRINSLTRLFQLKMTTNAALSLFLDGPSSVQSRCLLSLSPPTEESGGLSIFEVVLKVAIRGVPRIKSCASLTNLATTSIPLTIVWAVYLEMVDHTPYSLGPRLLHVRA